MLQGHSACSNHLQNKIAEILEHPALLYNACQQALLDELEVQFNEKDNRMLTDVPTNEKVDKSVRTSNIHGAPGSDGITSLV